MALNILINSEPHCAMYNGIRPNFVFAQYDMLIDFISMATLFEISNSP